MAAPGKRHVMLQELRPLIRKELSIVIATELTKLYKPLTDSLRLISLKL